MARPAYHPGGGHLLFGAGSPCTSGHLLFEVGSIQQETMAEFSALGLGLCRGDR